MHLKLFSIAIARQHYQNNDRIKIKFSVIVSISVNVNHWSKMYVCLSIVSICLSSLASNNDEKRYSNAISFKSWTCLSISWFCVCETENRDERKRNAFYRCAVLISIIDATAGVVVIVMFCSLIFIILCFFRCYCFVLFLLSTEHHSR